MHYFLSRVSRYAAALVFTGLATSSASAQDTIGSPEPAIDIAHPKAESTTTVGTLRVERYGHGSPALIFIPGLACGSWVWDDAVKTYAATHAVYLVTLAGFDGLPAPAQPALEGADASLLTLITNEKLERPVLIGHSLGGHLAIRFGEEHAALLRGVVSVDGTPVFPTLAQSTPKERLELADSFAGSVATSTPEKYRSAQNAAMATMVSDPANVEHIAALGARSDQKAVAMYTKDLLEADIRPQLPMLAVAALEIAPVPTAPQSFEPPDAAKSSMAVREERYKGFYEALFAGAPKLTVVTVANSKHFVMVDQPKALYDSISAFLATLAS